MNREPLLEILGRLEDAVSAGLPRDHHFIPDFYLAGFTPSGKKGDNVWATDRWSGKLINPTTKEAAFERDLYMVQSSAAVDPAMVERLLAEVETGGAEAIRYIIEH